MADNVVDSEMCTVTIVLLVLICGVSILGNGFVFWAMIVDKRLRTNSNLFILSLATADFLIGIISIPVYLALHVTQRDVLGVLCSAAGFLDNLLVVVSMWTLLLTSLDRFVLVIYRHLYKDLVSSKNSVLMITGVWVYGTVIAGLPLVGWNSYGFTGNSCAIARQDHPYYVFFFFMTFPAPVVTIVSCYVCIALKTHAVHKRTTAVHKNTQRTHRTISQDKVSRVTAMVLTLVVAHLLLTLPAFLVALIATYLDTPHVTYSNPGNTEHGTYSNPGVTHFSRFAPDVVIVMFFANTAVNPLLYGLFNTNFQSSLRTYCCFSNNNNSNNRNNRPLCCFKKNRAIKPAVNHVTCSQPTTAQYTSHVTATPGHVTCSYVTAV